METAKDKIRELRALYDGGLLSEEEFARRKEAALQPQRARDAARAQAGLRLAERQVIGPPNRRYRLQRLLGVGGMGQVWRGLDLTSGADLGLGEPVALKILPPQLTASAASARLLIEDATRARKLAHQHIVRVFEWAQDPSSGSHFLIMECLDGRDMERYLSEQGPLPLARVQELLRPLADALDYAWQTSQLAHQDIKPGNVFLTRAGEVKLLDFGIAARLRGAAWHLPLAHARALGYRAPEAGVLPRQPNPRLDVYAVAVMVYQMLEGRLPFGEDEGASRPAELTEPQWQVLQSGFALRPERRPASVSDLLEALARAASAAVPGLMAEAALARARAQQAQRDAAVRRLAEAQAAALEQVRVERLRREREVRQQALRAQLEAHREAHQMKARRLREDLQRRELAVRGAAEAMPLPSGPPAPLAAVAGALCDRFLDGSGVGPELVALPPGHFRMGSPEAERAVAMAAGALPAWLARETPQHKVVLDKPPALGRHPVTLGQWRRFAEATGWEAQSETDWRRPGFAQDERHPVVGVSWHDAQLYLRWLSGQTGQRYRLPSEAEWEYACRAGTATAFSFGDTISSAQANYDGLYTYNGGARGVYRGGTSAAGTFPSNPWGLEDMHGNVWEWVQDVVHDNYVGAPGDGSAWEAGGDASRRILRGGCWLYNPRYLRAALRNGFSAVLSNDIVGFRVARELP